ncbi:MAG: AAA family ATPase [Rhodoferax sp.]|nr:AAA family ATPase [Rhodoferax sp.]
MPEKDCYYVDKTGFAVGLFELGNYYFLSRPRRFGKSLFLDTLKDLFEGHQALFTGLAAEARWDWSVKYPVLRISFGAGVVHSRETLG